MLPGFSCWIQWCLEPAQVIFSELGIKTHDFHPTSTPPVHFNSSVTAKVSFRDADAFWLVENKGLVPSALLGSGRPRKGLTE